MLNSKDKIIQDFSDHFKTLGVNIELADKRVVFRDSLLNVSIVVHIIVAALTIQYTSSLIHNLYWASIAFFYVTVAYVIFWFDYSAINIVEFDLLNKIFHIKNRSILRRIVFTYIVPQPSKYYFEDCRAVEISTNKTVSFLRVKHFVNVVLKNGSRISLIGFSKEVNAILFSKFVTVLMD